MPLSKNAKITVVIALIAAVSISLVIVGIIYWTPDKGEPPGDEGWDLRELVFFGDTLAEPVSVSYDDITNGSLVIQFVNKTFTYLKSSGFSSTYNYTGVTLDDLITYANVTYGGATAFRFWGYDDWTSPAIPIRVWQQNIGLISVVFAQDGVQYQPPNGGDPSDDGPLMSIVNHSVLDPKVSSRFKVRNLAAVEFLDYPDWNVTIFGNVEKNSTVYYAELMTFFTHLSEQINYTTSGGSNMRNYQGISAFDVLDYSNFENTSEITGIKFIGSDLWATQIVSYTWVLKNDTDVLVAYARDGILLDPVSDGYLNSVVDYTLTTPTYSSQYKAKYLLYIEILA